MTCPHTICAIATVKHPNSFDLHELRLAPAEVRT